MMNVFKKSILIDKFEMGGHSMEIWIIEGRLQIRMADIGKVHSVDLPSHLAITKRDNLTVDFSKEGAVFDVDVLSELDVDVSTKWLLSFILNYMFNLSADELELKERVDKLYKKE